MARRQPKTAPHEANGHQGRLLAILEEQVSLGYRPTIPIEGMFTAAGMPQMTLRQDLELMLTHPVVRQALGYFKGGISGAEFWGGPHPDNPDDEQGLPVCQNEAIGRFIKEQCERFWDRGVPGIQSGYEYGWVGCENSYCDEDGVLKWDKLTHFSPRDTYLLTQNFVPVGVRIKNVQTRPQVDLWMASDNVPAKALWYPHNPRYNAYFGQSQLIGAWRPWRRLAWKDGAESVLDGAFYRFGIGPVIGRFPQEDLQGPNPGAPSTTADSEGNPRRFARDIMRQVGEQLKAGGYVGLPSTKDKTGDYKYAIEIPQTTLQGANNLIDYCKHLENQITQGIGVPPELLEASESGSGYSGRRIPLEAFLSNQQQIADAMLKLFVDQVLRPLVWWNWGPDIKFNIQVKSLIKTRTKQAQAANPQADARGPQPGQPQAQQQPQNDQERRNNQAMFSQQHALVTDRVREIARKIVRAA